MCDTVVVVDRDAVRLAKNSDRDANEAQLLEWWPAAEHAPGSRVRCTHMTVPQAERTHAVVLSRPFWMWGAEMGTNTHGVTIGNEAVFTTEHRREPALTGMDLLRLALERAHDADEAVHTIVTLLERYGQGGRCGWEDPSFSYDSSFLVADRGRAYVLETAGTRWAVEAVDAGVRSISNGLTIPGFAEAYADRLRGRVAACDLRRQRTAAAAGTRGDLAGLISLLRDHGGGARGPSYRVHNGALSAPCAHPGGVLASTQTTASWVSELSDDGDRHLATGTAAPCTSVFLPIAVDHPLPLGPAPTGVVDEQSWWWRHEAVHRRAIADPARWLPRIDADRSAVEQAVLAGTVDGGEALAAVTSLRQRWRDHLDADPPADTRPPLVRRYWSVRERAATAATGAGGR